MGNDLCLFAVRALHAAVTHDETPRARSTESAGSSEGSRREADLGQKQDYIEKNSENFG